jgi:transcriptional regulator with XRE-family HTH domain
MTHNEQGKYEFKKHSLIEIRKKMGLSKSKMAELLGVPANNLSKWELGTLVPDANSLAGFYSLAKENDITPEFFGLIDNMGPFQDNSMISLDFQTPGACIAHYTRKPR